MGKRLILTMAVAGIASVAVPLVAQQPGGATPAGASGGRGGGRGVVPAGARGGRAGGFPQYTRPAASEDALVRGKSLYDANCASCHAADLRGVLAKNGPNLLRSTETFSDKQGELIAANLAKHRPPVNL